MPFERRYICDGLGCGNVVAGSDGRQTPTRFCPACTAKREPQPSELEQAILNLLVRQFSHIPAYCKPVVEEILFLLAPAPLMTRAEMVARIEPVIENRAPSSSVRTFARQLADALCAAKE